ncbi:NmrA/HSCARG family protein [Streptomyces sp. NPDC087300]|uniref:NmrA/HSCARG family protein n=1 Tax=Streptomyces sp. NPDC087300 TaxID=3365780 RepID=UPI00380635C7
MLDSKKTIAVVGATGTQGGSLVRAVLADPEGPFAVRALTRDANSPSARHLSSLGAEVVEADLDAEATVRTAFEGAWGAFVVTNFWAARPEEDIKRRTAAEMELQQAGTAARAAREAGLRHVVWSTLEDTREVFPPAEGQLPVLEGKYTVPHFDAKADADRLFTAEGVPTTFLRTTFFYESFLRGMGPVRADDGSLVLTLPMADAKLAAVAADDIGRSALAVFRRGPEMAGRTVSIAGAHLTGTELAELFSTALGEKVTYRPLSLAEFRSIGAFGGDETANMFAYYVKAADAFTAARDIPTVRALNPDLQSFPDWLGRHASEFLK